MLGSHRYLRRRRTRQAQAIRPGLSRPDRSHSICPKDAHHFYGHGQAYAGRKEFDQALLLAEQANKTENENGWFSLAALAAARAAKCEFDQAIQAQERSLELAPPSWKKEFTRCLERYRKREPLKIPAPASP